MDTRQIIIATAIIFLTTAATSYTIDGGETEDIDTDWDETVTFDLEGTWVFNDGAPDTSGPSLFFGSEVQREEYGEETVRSPWPDREIAEETINITYVPQSDAEDNWPGNQEDVSSIEFEMLNGWEIKSRTDGQDEYTNDHVVLPPHPTADQWEYRCGNSHQDIPENDDPNADANLDCPEDYGLPANAYNWDSGDTFETDQTGIQFYSEETVTETIDSVQAGPEGDKSTADFKYDPEMVASDITGSYDKDFSGASSDDETTLEFTGTGPDGYWFWGPDFFLPNDKEIWMVYPRVESVEHLMTIESDELTYEDEDLYTDFDNSIDTGCSASGNETCDSTTSATRCFSGDRVEESHVDLELETKEFTFEIDPEADGPDRERDVNGDLESWSEHGDAMATYTEHELQRYDVNEDQVRDIEVEETDPLSPLEVTVTYEEAEYGEIDLYTSCDESTNTNVYDGCTSTGPGGSCGPTGSESYYTTETHEDIRNDDFVTHEKDLHFEQIHLEAEPVFTLNPETNPAGGGSGSYASDLPFIHDPEDTDDYMMRIDGLTNEVPERPEHTSVREGLFNNDPYKRNWDGPYEGFNVIEEENPSTYSGEPDDGSSDGGTIPYNRIDGETWFSYNVDSPDELLGNSPSVSLSRFSLDLKEPADAGHLGDNDEIDDGAFVSVREEQTNYNIDGENGFANGYIAMRHDIENEGTAHESRSDDWNIVGSTPHFVDEELESGEDSNFVTESDVEAYMSDVQCPEDKLTCVAAVDLYLDNLDDWDETIPTNVGSSIEMDYQIHHTSESLGVCKMFNELSDEEYDYDDSERTQCVDDLDPDSGTTPGGPSPGPGPGACDEPGINSHGMMGPEVDESRFYDEDDNVVNSDLEACVEHSQCVYHGDPVDEGTVRDVSRLPHYDGYEMGQDSPDFEVCLNMDSDRLDDDWDEYIYDPALEEFDEGPSWGGQWYDLDDPAVNDYLRDETPSPQDDEGIRSELVTEDKQEEHEENENHIAYYWRENINPFHSEWNPEGTELDEIHSNNPDYSEGITLEVNCGHLLFNFGDDLECEGSVNSIEFDTNRIYSFYQFAGDISE